MEVNLVNPRIFAAGAPERVQLHREPIVKARNVQDKTGADEVKVRGVLIQQSTTRLPPTQLASDQWF